MRVILFLILIATLSFGCKPKQKVAAAPPPPPATSDEMAAKQEAYNNMVISFYSKGEGVNAKAVEAIENFLVEYASKIKRTIPYTKTRWGREGEVDFCVSLAGLLSDERRIF